MKKLSVFVVAALFVSLLGAGMVLAGGPEGEGNFLACRNYETAEEALQARFERLEEMVEEEVLTEEEAALYREKIARRQEECSFSEEKCQQGERLGIGFGRDEGRGMQRGERDGTGRNSGGNGNRR